MVLGFQLLVNANIVTIDENLPGAQALAVRDGRILAVGALEEVEAAPGNNTTVRDMGGKTIVPGFIDAHGHVSMTAMLRGMADLQPPPASHSSLPCEPDCEPSVSTASKAHQDHASEPTASALYPYGNSWRCRPQSFAEIESLFARLRDCEQAAIRAKFSALC